MDIERIKTPAQIVHAAVVFTEEQRANCEKLAKYLQDHGPDEIVGISGEPFTGIAYDMGSYAWIQESNRTLFPQELKQHTCGTACCLLGHGPLAGIEPDPLTEVQLKQKEEGSLVNALLWLDYSWKFRPKAVLPEEFYLALRAEGAVLDNIDMHMHDCIYQFLFSGSWDEYDNTPEGGVRRLWYLMDHGLPLWHLAVPTWEAALRFRASDILHRYKPGDAMEEWVEFVHWKMNNPETN